MIESEEAVTWRIEKIIDKFHLLIQNNLVELTEDQYKNLYPYFLKVEEFYSITLLCKNIKGFPTKLLLDYTNDLPPGVVPSEAIEGELLERLRINTSDISALKIMIFEVREFYDGVHDIHRWASMTEMKTFRVILKKLSKQAREISSVFTLGPQNKLASSNYLIDLNLNRMELFFLYNYLGNHSMLDEDFLRSLLHSYIRKHKITEVLNS
ncbi:hypothetical protein ACFS7Z_08550 [Pontibacter toksunensis]|uniref:Uncharacterized protein n=1 Tax=Pontibacter toksunensis TaxID=1332631 RepID=A0ABW6BRF2_9BACT